MLARYNSIGFKGLNGAETFVTLSTKEGEIRAFLTNTAQKAMLSSHNIGKTFRVTLSDSQKEGFHTIANLLDAKPA